MAFEKPIIAARFIKDASGKLAGSSGEYGIQLFVKDAPPDAYAVTYQLDPTYYDSVREVRDKENGFIEEITSYGDFDVMARVRTKSFPVTIRRSLYDALQESHLSDPDPAIQQALQDIKNN